MHLYQGHLQTVDSSGVPRSGALLYFYQSGTTTLITVYQDSGKAVSHANPVVADSSGRFAPIWVDTTPYKTVLKTSGGTTIQTEDAIYANNTLTEGRFSIATASTVDLDATEYMQGDLTLTNTVATVTLASGHMRMARAVSGFTLTAGASLVVNGSTTVDGAVAAGRMVRFYGAAAGVVYAEIANPSISDTQAGIVEAAVQSEMEAGSSTTLAVTPGRQQFHPSAAKFWLFCDAAGTAAASYNITSITDTATGVVDITIATDFSSINWCSIATATGADTDPRHAQISSSTPKAAGTVRVLCFNDATALTDPVHYSILGFGDQ